MYACVLCVLELKYLCHIYHQGVKVSDLGRPKEMSEQVYQTMAGMTILVTHLVVEFAKKIPGFLQLKCKDQITLLKVSDDLIEAYCLCFLLLISFAIYLTLAVLHVAIFHLITFADALLQITTS